MSAVYTLDKIFNNLLNNSEPLGIHNYSCDSNEYYQTSTDGEVVIEMSMPGISKENLKVNIEQNTLIIEAKPSIKSKAERGVKKCWYLPDNVDIDNITAKLENGLLTLTMPKIKPAKKTVSVTVS